MEKENFFRIVLPDATIVSSRAGDMISEFILAMKVLEKSHKWRR